MEKGSVNPSGVMVPPGQGWWSSGRNPCGRGSRALWCCGGRAVGGELFTAVFVGTGDCLRLCFWEARGSWKCVGRENMGWDKAAVIFIGSCWLNQQVVLHLWRRRRHPSSSLELLCARSLCLFCCTQTCHFSLSSFGILFFLAFHSLALLAVKQGTALYLTSQKLSHEDSVCFEAPVSWAAGI